MATNSNTTPDIAGAYGVTNEFEVSILNKLKAVQDTREAQALKNSADLAAIVAEFPEVARNGQVYRCAVNMQNQSVSAGYAYDLAPLRQQYGLDPMPGMTPAPVTPAS